MMNRLILFITILSFTGSVAIAQPKSRFEFAMHYGYQQENLHWSIAGNAAGTSPNVYSELKWMHNGGFAAGADLKFNLFNHIKLFAGFNRLQINSGRADDTDYAQDNRTGVVYAGHFDSDKGYSSAYNAGAGYEILLTGKLRLTPALGYVLSKQSLYLVDNSGQLADLNSSYNTHWKGPFSKLEAGLQLLPSFKIAASAMYSQVIYNAEANWNLIPNFVHPVSYRHKANGYGLDAGLRFTFKLKDHIALTAGGSYFNWQTGKGTDELYLTNSNTDYTQMNGAFRHGYQLSGGTVFSF